MPPKVSIPSGSPARKSWSCKGANLDEVFKNLNKHGWWGRYRSNLAYNAKLGSNVVSVSVTAKPVVIMPKWAQYGKASADDKKAWDKMYKALLKHETNHHTITDTHLKELKKNLEKGGEIDGKELKKAWESSMKELEKKQKTYDSRTDHGSKEGVKL